jgi:hypothetical protein
VPKGPVKRWSRFLRYQCYKTFLFITEEEAN